MYYHWWRRRGKEFIFWRKEGFERQDKGRFHMPLKRPPKNKFPICPPKSENCALCIFPFFPCQLGAIQKSRWERQVCSFEARTYTDFPICTSQVLSPLKSAEKEKRGNSLIFSSEVPILEARESGEGKVQGGC